MPENNSEKRSELRLLDHVAVFIETFSSPLDDEATKLNITSTLDISANGIQVVTNLPLIESSLLQICIDVENHRFYLTGEVMWCTEINEQFQVGFKLTKSDQTDISSWKNYICQKLQSIDD